MHPSFKAKDVKDSRERVLVTAYTGDTKKHAWGVLGPRLILGPLLEAMEELILDQELGWLKWWGGGDQRIKGGKLQESVKKRKEVKDREDGHPRMSPNHLSRKEKMQMKNS